MKPIIDTELDTLLVAVHDGTQGSYSENLRAAVNKLLEQRAAEAAAGLTDEDVQAMMIVCPAWDALGLRAAAEALAKRWGPRTTYQLSPDVTAELERLIMEGVR